MPSDTAPVISAEASTSEAVNTPTVRPPSRSRTPNNRATRAASGLPVAAIAKRGASRQLAMVASAFA